MLYAWHYVWRGTDFQHAAQTWRICVLQGSCAVRVQQTLLIKNPSPRAEQSLHAFENRKQRQHLVQQEVRHVTRATARSSLVKEMNLENDPGIPSSARVLWLCARRTRRSHDAGLNDVMHIFKYYNAQKCHAVCWAGKLFGTRDRLFL